MKSTIILVAVAVAAVFVSAAAAGECPSNTLRDKSAEFARTLATKGFDLTDYDLYINRPLLTKEETCIRPTPDEAVACNEVFRQAYRDGLMKAGKSEPEIEAWFAKVFVRGEITAPRKACDS